MKFYKDSFNRFWLNGALTPSGNHSLRLDGNSITITENEDNTTVYSGLLTNVLREDNTPYTDSDDFLLSVGDFFKSTSSGGTGSDTVFSVNSKTGDVVLTKTDIGLSNVKNLDTTNPSNITTDSEHRFVTDLEKEVYGNPIYTDTVTGLKYKIQVTNGILGKIQIL
jgi:hypothetical protein